MADFELSIKKFGEKAIKKTDAIIRKTAFDLTNAIIMDTPVDTGRARGNWIVSIDRQDDRKIDTEDKSGASTIAKAQNEIFNNPIQKEIWIQNNLEYIARLEYGWSDKSPQGMVGVNVQRFNHILEKVARDEK